MLAAGFRHDPSIPAWAANQLLGPDHGASLGAAVLARLGGLLEERLQIIFWLIFALSAASFLISWIFPPVSTAPAAEQAIQVPELESAPTEV